MYDRVGWWRCLKQPSSELPRSGGLLAYELGISEQLLAKLRWFESRVEREMHVIADELGAQFDSGLYKGITANGALLELAAPIFTRIWLSDALDHALNPRRPQLYNTDGDEIVLCTLRLEETASQEMACAALAIIDDLRAASDTFFNWSGRRSVNCLQIFRAT